MKHGEFISKLDFSRMVEKFHNGGAKDFKMTAEEFRVTPMRVGSLLKYATAHANDPYYPWLGERRDSEVRRLSAEFDLSNEALLKNDLIKRFGATTEKLQKRWPQSAFKADVIKLMKISGLRWFLLDGVPRIHWNEKETTSV